MGFAPPSSSVAKGPILHCLDELSVRRDARSKLEQLRTEILRLREAEFRGLEDVFGRYLLSDFYSADQVGKITTHLRTRWFTEETGWWPAFQPVAPIYASGVLRTLNASLSAKDQRPIPIDSYWIIGHGEVQMVNLVSGQQVTLLVVTPAPVDYAPAGIQGEASEAWVTARRAGRLEGEIDPGTEQAVSGGPGLRVRTFKVDTRAPGGR